jgi:hypothetical protein
MLSHCPCASPFTDGMSNRPPNLLWSSLPSPSIAACHPAYSARLVSLLRLRLSTFFFFFSLSPASQETLCARQSRHTTPEPSLASAYLHIVQINLGSSPLRLKRTKTFDKCWQDVLLARELKAAPGTKRHRQGDAPRDPAQSKDER